MNLFEAMRYLAALHRHRHFGHAAQALHITQPGLSNAIRAMEDELGVAIVRRGRRYEGLTDEGELVLACAHRMLREQEVLRQELAVRRRQPAGGLVIGSVPTAIPVAARFAARLRARNPGISITLHSLSLHEIEAGIDNLGIDIGFGYIERASRGAGERLKVIRQYDERYFVLRQLPATARGQRRIGRPIRWRDAAALPLCVLAPEMYHHRALVDTAFARAGVQPHYAIETSALLALMVTTQTGDACSVLPGSLVALAMRMPGMQARPLVEPEVVTGIGLLTLGDGHLSLAHKAALALARDEAWLREAARHGALVTR
jgi:DNA-binding transcriptional LysR family regulator